MSKAQGCSPNIINKLKLRVKMELYTNSVNCWEGNKKFFNAPSSLIGWKNFVVFRFKLGEF